MIEFLTEFIVSFGVPRIIVTDSGTQFVGEKLESTLAKLKIQHLKASIYPQASGKSRLPIELFFKG